MVRGCIQTLIRNDPVDPPLSLQQKGKKIIGGIGVSKEATEDTQMGMGPHGVPMNPNLRNLSSSNLDQMATNTEPGYQHTIQFLFRFYCCKIADMINHILFLLVVVTISSYSSFFSS